MAIEVTPLTLREANAVVAQHHRHNDPVRGCRFAIGALHSGQIAGVAIVGRPLARLLQDGVTAEVLRVCTLPAAPKGTCSFLYGRCWRIWQAMGGRRMVTYTLPSESGACMRAVGWKLIGETKPPRAGWSRSGRERDWKAIDGQLKLRWAIEEA